MGFPESASLREVLRGNPLGTADLTAGTEVVVYYGDPDDMNVAPQISFMGTVYHYSPADSTLAMLTSIEVAETPPAQAGDPPGLTIIEAQPRGDHQPPHVVYQLHDGVRFADGHAYNAWLEANSTERE